MILRNTLLRTACCVLTFIATTTATAATDDNNSEYMPHLHGTIRSRFETATESGYNRFQVRNARLSVDGKISDAFDYFFNTDVCDRGKMKILDAWARISMPHNFALRAGQFRMPFGVDPFRAPHQYYFSNRSFIGNQVCNYRAVGAELAYSPTATPLEIKAGVFNPTSMSDHSVWQHSIAYAGKLSYRISELKLTTGIMSIMPDSVRTNIVDACANFTHGRWILESEYMHKHYTHSNQKACNAYLVYARYNMPINLEPFNQISFQSRFDGMTAHSNSTRNSMGSLYTTNPARNRITVGATLSYIHSKNRFVDLRADFEKYFYHSNVVAPMGETDKVVVEIVLRF